MSKMGPQRSRSQEWMKVVRTVRRSVYGLDSECSSSQTWVTNCNRTWQQLLPTPVESYRIYLWHFGRCSSILHRHSWYRKRFCVFAARVLPSHRWWWCVFGASWPWGCRWHCTLLWWLGRTFCCRSCCCCWRLRQQGFLRMETRHCGCHGWLGRVWDSVSWLVVLHHHDEFEPRKMKRRDGRQDLCTTCHYLFGDVATMNWPSYDHFQSLEAPNIAINTWET